MKSYCPSDLFELFNSGNFPLDVEFIPKKQLPEELSQRGIYLMFFEQQLIYIGLADKEPAIIRFEKQLSTVTLRGSRVSFNSISQEAVLTSQKLSQSFDESILSLNENDFETSLRRIAFAENNWPLFSRLNQALLNHFVFVWFPHNPCFTKSLPEICDEWRRTLKPICNG